MKPNLSSYPDRINILKTLTSKDALKYSELKSLAGYESRKHSLMFCDTFLIFYHDSKGPLAFFAVFASQNKGSREGL